MDSDLLLKTVQDMEYEALCAMKKFCDENGITFLLRSGSVLGAVKYHNFVPWDDDIDIAFPRQDYLRLIEIMPEYFGEKFRFVSYQKTENAHCYFPRVLLREEYRKKLGLPKNNERGLVLIDVLPLDGMPSGGIGMKLHITKAYMYRVLASLWTLDVKDTVSMHTGGKQKILRFLHALRIHRLYKQDDIYRKLDRLYGKYPYGETKYAGMLAGSKLKKEIMPYEWLQRGTKGSFRDEEFLIPVEYDPYLKQIFGENYATYEPPPEMRKKSHLRGTAG